MRLFPKKTITEELETIISIPVDRNNAPNHEFIESIKISDKMGHIHKYIHTGEYCLSLSDDNTVRVDGNECVDTDYFRLFAFYRYSLKDIMDLLDTFINAEPSLAAGRTIIRDGRRVPIPPTDAEPLSRDITIKWCDRILGRSLENIITGERFRLDGMTRTQTVKRMGIKAYHIEDILYRRAVHSYWRLASATPQV